MLGSACAQESVLPLPPVYMAQTRVPGSFVSHPDSAAELPQPIFDVPQFQRQVSPAPYQPLPQAIGSNEVLPESCLQEPVCTVPLTPQKNPDLPPDARDGMFQKLIFTSTWLDSGGSGGLGITEMDLRTILALPIPSRKAPMLITPGFGTYF